MSRPKSSVHVQSSDALREQARDHARQLDGGGKHEVCQQKCNKVQLQTRELTREMTRDSPAPPNCTAGHQTANKSGLLRSNVYVHTSDATRGGTNATAGHGTNVPEHGGDVRVDTRDPRCRSFDQPATESIRDQTNINDHNWKATAYPRDLTRDIPEHVRDKKRDGVRTGLGQQNAAAVAGVCSQASPPRRNVGVWSRELACGETRDWPGGAVSPAASGRGSPGSKKDALRTMVGKIRELQGQRNREQCEEKRELLGMAALATFEQLKMLMEETQLRHAPLPDQSPQPRLECATRDARNEQMAPQIASDPRMGPEWVLRQVEDVHVPRGRDNVESGPSHTEESRKRVWEDAVPAPNVFLFDGGSNDRKLKCAELCGPGEETHEPTAVLPHENNDCLVGPIPPRLCGPAHRVAGEARNVEMNGSGGSDEEHKGPRTVFSNVPAKLWMPPPSSYYPLTSGMLPAQPHGYTNGSSAVTTSDSGRGKGDHGWMAYASY